MSTFKSMKGVKLLGSGWKSSAGRYLTLKGWGWQHASCRFSKLEQKRQMPNVVISIIPGEKNDKFRVIRYPMNWLAGIAEDERQVGNLVEFLNRLEYPPRWDNEWRLLQVKKWWKKVVVEGQFYLEHYPYGVLLK